MKNLGVSEIIVIFAPVLFDEQQSRKNTATFFN